MIKKIAVENFLGSMDMSQYAHVHIENAHMDARLYKWNFETRDAIIRGIKKAYLSSANPRMGGPL